ncbi:Krueppel-like factor 17 [Heterocephalus glaber]|uniref:Krueppel-like factor 17 n=1 Tax=Heterocephalus glaber TaxID=10181 RepID=G5B235_HETGA|nr:Krueppel-like factor 17 [Heterocephalus glaber]
MGWSGSVSDSSSVQLVFQGKMEQGDEEQSQWQPVNQPFQDNVKPSSIMDMWPSSRSSGVYTSWNHSPPGTEHCSQGREIMGTLLVSYETTRQDAGEVRAHFSVSQNEHTVSYCLQCTLTPYQKICQSMSPSHPGMIGRGPQLMPLEPGIQGGDLTCSENLRTQQASVSFKW